MQEQESEIKRSCPDIMGRDVLPQLEAERRLKLVAEEATGTFDVDDVEAMSEQGLIVLPLAWGQGVYRRVEEE